jgi:hypothetical protein
MTARGLLTVDQILNASSNGSNPSPQDSLTIIRTELERLNGRLIEMNKFRDYYSGEQKLVFGSTEFINLYGAQFANFRDNWAKVVVNAVAHRLEIEGLAITEELVEEEGQESTRDSNEDLALDIWRILARNNWDEQQDDLFNGALVEGRSSLIVWPDPVLGARVDWNPGQNVIVRWDDDHRKIVWALKVWRTPSAATRINLYYPDRLEKYRDNSTVRREPDINPTPFEEIVNEGASGSNYELFATVQNTLDEVPVVEFQNPEGSEIRDTIAQQDALNYIIVSSLIGAGLAGWSQKVMMTNVREPTGGWNNNPGKVWQLPHTYDPDGNPIESKIGEFTAADLDKFINLTQEMLRHVAATSFTPMRFFYQSDRGGRGDAASGESLRVDDEGLIDKVEVKQDRFGNRAYDAFRLVAKAAKLDYGKTFPVGEPYWRDPQARHMTVLLQDAKLMLDIGLPFEFVVEKIGLGPLDIKRVQEMREKEREDAAKEAAELAKATAAGASLPLKPGSPPRPGAPAATPPAVTPPTRPTSAPRPPSTP